MITGDHVGYGNYADSTASEGPEVQCSYVHADDEHVVMDALEFLGFDAEPKSVAIQVPHVSAGAKNPVEGSHYVEGTDWYADYSAALPNTAQDYSGTWYGYMSEVQADGSPADQTTYNSGFYYEWGVSASSSRGTDVFSAYGTFGTWTGEYELAAHPNQAASNDGVRMFPILLDGDIGFGTLTSLTVLDPGDGQALTIGGATYTLATGATIPLFNVGLGSPMYVVMDPAGTGETPRLQINGNTPTGWTPWAHVGKAYTLPTALAAAVAATTGDQIWIVRDYLRGINLEAVGSGYSLGARYTSTARTDFVLHLSQGWTVEGTVTNRSPNSITVQLTEISGFPVSNLEGTWTFAAL
ncbi:hypothetical protein L6R53_14220 [Myxococcota bacterium]|nr:hypothetical protein [Myxococcota bacterium]